VGHPEKALSHMGRGEAASREIGTPDSIAQRFQVSPYSGEPLAAKRTCNLLSKNRWRQAVFDEALKLRPQMARVSGGKLFPGLGKGLAGWTPGPYRTLLLPIRQAKGIRPAPDPGKEMALSVFNEFFRSDIFDASLIDDSIWDVSFFDQLTKPCGSVRIVFVVVVHWFSNWTDTHLCA
jgi:hypothetical protein